MHPTELQNRVRELIEPTVSRLGYDLVAVEWVSGLLRLSIEKPGGIGIGDCSSVSRRLSPILDEADLVKGKHRVEVSSPGIERPVQRLDDFRRFTGYTVKLRLVEGHPRRRFTGVIREVEGDDVTIDASGETFVFHIDAVERAHLVLTLDEYQRLAEGPPPEPSAEGDRDDQQ